MGCFPAVMTDLAEVTNEMRERAFTSAEADLRDAIALAKKYDVPTICLPQVIELYTSHLSGQLMRAEQTRMKERAKRRREKMQARMKQAGVAGVGLPGQMMPPYVGGYVGQVPGGLFDDEDDDV